MIAALLAELPAVLITGPRAAGKTTTAARHTATHVRLDRVIEAEAFRADPDAALRGLAEPVLLDEWQAVPEVLGAVKRLVDADPRPGRFVIAGSVRADLRATTWPGTGRVVRVRMYPMTIAEQVGRPDTVPLLDRLVDGDPLNPVDDALDLRDYVAMALRGGFPEATLARSDMARERWLESYLDQLLTRDALEVEGGRDPARLRRFFEAYALSSAGLVEFKTLAESAGINVRTARAYERLLANLMVVDALPAWATNRLKRLVRTEKRYVVDPGLIGAVIRASVNAVLRDGNLLGRVLDTFVAAQLRPEVELAASRPRLYHLRQEQGRHEVDLIAEFGAERLVGIEVKASGGPRPDDARHLAWLRDQLADRFIAGVVLHTGPRTYSLGPKITAAPIATLWT